MLRVISANLNGIRSADKKGFFDWLVREPADIVCVQELKAQAGDLSERMRAPDGLTGYFHYAEKKGYSGVGVYTRHAPDTVPRLLSHDSWDRLQPPRDPELGKWKKMDGWIFKDFIYILIYSETVLC